MNAADALAKCERLQQEIKQLREENAWLRKTLELVKGELTLGQLGNLTEVMDIDHWKQSPWR